MEWSTSAVCVLLLALICDIQVNAKRARALNHVNNICSLWGNFHFKTFDGDSYQFQGMCDYNLVSDCQSLVRQFSVHVKRTEHTTDPKISRVAVTINDISVEMTPNQVMVNEHIVTLPIHVAGILVEENTIYTKLYSKLGISVMWNREDAVMVELDGKYSNRTCGLCGDFNGIPVYNEFIQSGRKVGHVEFGNMHRVPNPMHVCEDPFENDDEQNVLDQCEKYREACADILEDEDWSSCTKVLSPEPYVKACVNDMCLGQIGDVSSLCATLSEYSRQCSHAGGTPPTWRTEQFCAVKCPFNMVHSESDSPCMDTCSHKDTNTLCEEHNIDGCFCPRGTVFDDISNMGCIPVEQCHCKHDRNYKPGEVLLKDDEECICQEGNWICMSLPSPGLCALEEGSHFTTYDGKEFTFHGDCNYVLSKDCIDSKFIILGQIVPCLTHETDTCLKSIVVLLDNDKKNPLLIKPDGTVQHNAEVPLPYNTADFTVFRPSSFYIMLQTSFGLQVQVQLVPIMQVYITVDQSFQGKTCGLCGNFNKVLSDDLKTPQGLVEGTAGSFANAWKAQSNCPDRTERMDDPCSYSTDSEHFAEHWCSKMKDKESPFAKCHSTVNPESYYKRCKYSSCTCEKSEDCMCAVFSSYTRACAAKGIFLQGWRQAVCEKYTENCPASQNYSYQLQSCQHTCLSLSSERQGCNVDFVPVDGCACPDGLYQDESGLCVPMEKCPCYHNGQKIRPGRSVILKDEHCVCMNGKFHCRSSKARLLECSHPKVFFNCSTAGPDEHGLDCARTCLQQEVDCFSLDCESGCQCPTGLLDDGKGHCVKSHECPCPHNGQFYAVGSEIIMDCNKCTCQRGTWSCTDNKCPGICTIYGSGHYQTFDQQRFGFRGDCSYIATQDKCGNKTGNFHVITENMPCGTTGTTCSKAVGILLGRTKLELSEGTVRASDTGSGPQIKYKQRNIGMYLVIDAVIGLTVLWDRKTTVRIILQPQHMGEVCGLCGNFNGNGKDDFTTQGKLQTSNIMEFVDSWKVLSTCPDAEPDSNPCYETPNRHTWAKIQCSIIKAETFKDCHSMVDPDPFYDNCVKDSCACDSGGDCECFCTAVAAYAQACNDEGVCVVWRTPDICPVYCDYYNGPGECTWHYSPCHTPCYKTCLNPEGICNNTLPNLEGCYPQCPEDKPIFDEKNQICVEACNHTCNVDGVEYEPGEEIPTDKPCNMCICDENGKIHCFQRPGCCFYNGTEYNHNEVIYNVTDGMGMCYYAICINTTVFETQEPCSTSTPPPGPTIPPTSTISTQYTPTVQTTSTAPIITTTKVESTTAEEFTSSQNPSQTPTKITTSGTPPLSSTEFTESPTTWKPVTTTPFLSTKSTKITATTEKPISSTPTGSTPTSKFTESTTVLESTTSAQTPKPPTFSTPSTTTTVISTTTGTPSGISTTLSAISPCVICHWSEWFNVYNPATGGGNDFETYEHITENGKEICENPEDIECGAVGQTDMSFEDFISQTKQVVQCNVSYGLVCEKTKQVFRPYKCFDYTIRVLCCFPCSTTSPGTTSGTPPLSSTEYTESPTTWKPATTTHFESTKSTTGVESTTSAQTPKPPTGSSPSPTPIKITATTEKPISSTPTGSTPTTTFTESTTAVESTTSAQTPEPPTFSTPSTTPTVFTTTTGKPISSTPTGSTPTIKFTESTTALESTTSAQTPKPPTFSTPLTTPTVITTTTEKPISSTPTGSTPTTKFTESTTAVESTTSAQTPEPPTFSTPSTTPTVITTTTEKPISSTPTGSTPTTKFTESTTAVESTTSAQTPEPPTFSTPSTTPTVITTTTEKPISSTTTGSTPTTTFTESTTALESTTSAQTPKLPTFSTPLTTPTVITTTTEKPISSTPTGSTPTTKFTESTTAVESTTSAQTPEPPTFSTPSTTPTVITTTTEKPISSTTAESTPTTKFTESTTALESTTSAQTPKPPTFSTPLTTPTVITTTTEKPISSTPTGSTPTTKFTESTTAVESTTSAQTPEPPTFSTPSTTPTVITTTTEKPISSTPTGSTPTTTFTESTTALESTTSAQTPKLPTFSTPLTTPTVITKTTEKPISSTPTGSTPTTTFTESTTVLESTTSAQTPKPPTFSTPLTTPTVITTTTEKPISSTPTGSTPTTKFTESTTALESSTSAQTPKPPTFSTPLTTPTVISTTTGTPSGISTSSSAISPCVICHWSEWFNVYNPATGGGNDFETYEHITENGKEICENPEDIECGAVGQTDMSFEDFISQTKQVVQCNISYGLVCEKTKQVFRPYKCFDYKIRVLCCFPCSTTSPGTTPISIVTQETNTTSPVSEPQIKLTTTWKPSTTTHFEVTESTTAVESTTSAEAPKPPTGSSPSPTPTKITATTEKPISSTPTGSTPTTKFTESTTEVESTTSAQTPEPPTFSTPSTTPTVITTTTEKPISSTPTGSTPTTTFTESTTAVESTTSAQTPKLPTFSTPLTTPTVITTTTEKPISSTPTGSTPTTTFIESTTALESTTLAQTPKPPTGSSPSPTPTKITATTEKPISSTPTGSTPTTTFTESTTEIESTTSAQTPEPPTFSTPSTTPTVITTTTEKPISSTPTGSTPTTTFTESTTAVESTTSAQTPKPPTFSTPLTTPTVITTTTEKPISSTTTGSTPTTKFIESTTALESTTSAQTPKPPTFSTSLTTPTVITTTTEKPISSTPTGSTPTTKFTESTTVLESTTSAQTPEPPTFSTPLTTPTVITTTTEKPISSTPTGSTPTNKFTESTTVLESSTSAQTPKPPTFSTPLTTPTVITTTTEKSISSTPTGSTPTTTFTESTTAVESTTSAQTPKPPTGSSPSPTPTKITATTEKPISSTPTGSTPTTTFIESTTALESTTSAQTPKPPTFSTPLTTPTVITTTTEKPISSTPTGSTPTTTFTESTTALESTTSAQTPKPPTFSTPLTTPTVITTTTEKPISSTPTGSTPTTKFTESTTALESTTSAQTSEPPTFSTPSTTPTVITTTTEKPISSTTTGSTPTTTFTESTTAVESTTSAQTPKPPTFSTPLTTPTVITTTEKPISSTTTGSTPTTTFTESTTALESTTSAQTPKPPTFSTPLTTPTVITTTTEKPISSTPTGSTPTITFTESTTALESTTSAQTPKPPTFSTPLTTPTVITTTTEKPISSTPTGSTPTTKFTESTTALESTTSAQTPKPPTFSTPLTTPTVITTTTEKPISSTPTGSTPTTKFTESTAALESTTSAQTPKPPTFSTPLTTPTVITTTTEKPISSTPTGSTPTTKFTEPTTVEESTTSAQTPKPPTFSTPLTTPTVITTTTEKPISSTPTGSTPTTKFTEPTTVEESTTSAQTPKPPTFSTPLTTPTVITTTTEKPISSTPTGSTPTTKFTEPTTVEESTTSAQTPKPPTFSTPLTTPTVITTTTEKPISSTPTGSTPTTKFTEPTTVEESTTSAQTPEPPTSSTSLPTPTVITTTTAKTPISSTPTVSSPTTLAMEYSTTTGKTSPSTTPTTTPCFCVINGMQYNPGETIFDMIHIGSGICLTMICSETCAFQNSTEPCPTPTTPTPTPSTTLTPTPSTSPTPTPYYDCPEWEKNTNETFILCNCTMARCIEDNIIEIIPYECPPLQNITCANGKNPVLVYDEYYCCQYYACDCFCEGWGDPHYITFDGLFYSYQGNCTYVLMEEIRPQHHLKIYIDNVYCDPIELVSCPRSIIVSYNNQVITLKNHNFIGGADLEAVKDNVKLRLPFASNGVRVISSGLDLFLEIPLLNIVVTFGATGFSINLPFQHFGNNTQGHCGTCNNNMADDCMLPGGILVDDCAAMADYWPANGVNGEICSKPTALPTVGSGPKPTIKPCQAHPDCDLFRSELFQECLPYVSPVNFFLGCQYDSCHMSNPSVVCTSLQSYARACSQFGICIHWRNSTKLCNIECSEDKVFKPCGPAEPPTCDDEPEEIMITVPTEGCFCPEGTMLFNKQSGVCVDKCGCLDSSGTPREFDEVFQYNCEECVCERASKSVNCRQKQCPDPNPQSCTEPGFVLVNTTDPSDPCCNKQVCKCDITMCSPLDKKCGIGYSPQMEVPEGKCCPEIKCVPKRVCVHKKQEYEPGTIIPVVDCQECTCTWDVDPKSQLFKIRCGFVQCNENCDPGYEYIESNNDDCCGKCVQTHCIISVNGTTHILQEGAVLPTTNQGCDRITCTKSNGQFITDNYRIQCPPFNISNCQPGTVQLSVDGCCPVCVDKNRGCQVKTVRDYILHKDCQSERKIDLTFCEGDCASYSRYSELGVSTCSCCQATHTSNRTVALGCVNGDIVTHTYVHVEQCTCSKTNCHSSGVSQHILIENARRKRSLRLP